MPEPLALCQQVSKTYKTQSGGIEALHAVDAQFQAGQVTALVGASGSGKSTLLRVLAGLDRPSSGSTLVAGRELADASAETLRRHRRSGVTFINQKPADNLIPHLSLREHDRGRGVSLLVEFGLAHRLDAKPGGLSGGEQARAAFALALARGTAMLLADEPTAELDRGSAAPLLAMIRAHAESGAALVIATHDDDVTALADTVLRLDRGRVIDDTALPAKGRRPARATEDTTVLSAHGLGKDYRRGAEQIHALTDASLDLRHGELAALLGRSGSGKSTLLAILAGLQRPDRGELTRPPASRRPGPGSPSSRNASGCSPNSRSARTSNTRPALTAVSPSAAQPSSSSSTGSDSASSPTGNPTKPRSASNNGQRSRARSSSNQTSCSQTSPPPTRTQAGATPSGNSSSTPPKTAPAA